MGNVSKFWKFRRCTPGNPWTHVSPDTANCGRQIRDQPPVIWYHRLRTYVHTCIHMYKYKNKKINRRSKNLDPCGGRQMRWWEAAKIFGGVIGICGGARPQPPPLISHEPHTLRVVAPLASLVWFDLSNLASLLPCLPFLSVQSSSSLDTTHEPILLLPLLHPKLFLPYILFKIFFLFTSYFQPQLLLFLR